jgi:hypothetical protein
MDTTGAVGKNADVEGVMHRIVSTILAEQSALRGACGLGGLTGEKDACIMEFHRLRRTCPPSHLRESLHSIRLLRRELELNLRLAAARAVVLREVSDIQTSAYEEAEGFGVYSRNRRRTHG